MCVALQVLTGNIKETKKRGPEGPLFISHLVSGEVVVLDFQVFLQEEGAEVAQVLLAD